MDNYKCIQSCSHCQSLRDTVPWHTPHSVHTHTHPHTSTETGRAIVPLSNPKRHSDIHNLTVTCHHMQFLLNIPKIFVDQILCPACVLSHCLNDQSHARPHYQQPHTLPHAVFPSPIVTHAISHRLILQVAGHMSSHRDRWNHPDAVHKVFVHYNFQW